ncbi:MAG TPA: Uma2 family endonuclease [Pirellulales bacterium]|nr:Uma2 family endonuclease [Pirellulales bacterium]
MLRSAEFEPSPYGEGRLEAGDHLDQSTFHRLYLATPGVGSLDNATVLLPPDSEPQPDGTLIIKPDHGGRTRLEDGYLAGAPELVVEIASSSVSYDLHSKYRLYERVGVQEYVVAVLGEKQARWFVAEKGKFVSMAADADGIFRSRVFPGLWLDAAALWSDDDAKLLQAVQQGIASPEHRVFVDKLQSQRG